MHIFKLKLSGTRCFLMLILILLVTSSQTINAQQHLLGKRSEIVLKLRQAVQNTNLDKQFTLDLGTGVVIKAQLKYFKKESTELFTGDVLAPFNGTLSIKHDSLGALSGHIIFLKNKLSFILNSDSTDLIYSTLEDIHKVICVDYAEADTTKTIEEAPLALDDTPDAYKLQSYPAAAAVAYLDFDGETVTGTSWSNGATINATRTNFSQTDMKRMWKMVSEDYMPFNINVTTDRAVYDKAARGKRIQCIFTTNDAAAPGAGGVAYVGSFRSTSAIADPCWVFNRDAKSAGEAASHEIGHTLGLSHDGRTTPKESYYYGQGNWAPIMGAGYSERLVQWSKGEYTSANNREDDLAIISGRNNGFGYKVDDHANQVASATLLNVENTGNVVIAKNEGVIETRTDIDLFKFTTSGGLVSLQIKPAAQDPDLDISVRLLDANNAVVATSTKTGTALDAAISQTLNPGTYFIEVDGIGDADQLSSGYSDYASVGYFSIGGTIPVVASGVLPTVSITAPLNNATFSENATVTINATAARQGGTITKVEFYNGSNKLSEDLETPYSYTWSNLAAGTYTLTAIAYDNISGTATSSPVMIIVNKTVPVNVPPVVALTAPLDGVTRASLATFGLTASASDKDGSITKVEFYNGTNLLFTDTQSPYSYTWRNVIAGTYNLTAVAYDNSNANTRSDTIEVKVINDTDRDGIADETDNCVSTVNPDQIDADNNGIGDACDVIPTAVNDLDDAFQFRIIPNPYQQLANIQVPSGQVSQIKIYNASGKLLKELEGTENIAMPSDLIPGVYQVMMINGNKIYHQMVIKD